MSAIQNQNALWCKKRQCDAKVVKSKTKTRPPTMSKSLKTKAGPTAMQKNLKQNPRKVVIYENMLRPAAGGRSQTTASEGCEKILTNTSKHHMSTSTPTTNARNMYQHKNGA